MSQIYCTTELNYAGEVEYEPTEVVISNGRLCLDTLDFEQCGFTLLKHETLVGNWYDEKMVNEVHIPEIRDLSKSFTACDHAIVYPPLVRSPATAKEESDYAPIESVHSDYSDDYYPMVTTASRSYQQFLQPLLERDGLTLKDVQNARRLMVIQFWRNIGDIEPDFPLALCDASKVKRSEIMPIQVPVYGGLRLDFEALAIRAPTDPASHDWYTFPRLASNEVLAFRTFDSECLEQGRAFWTPHTAFRDPVTGPDAPRRESVEMRALCLFN